MDPTLLSETLHRRIPDLVWRHTASGIALVGEHQTRPDPTLGWRLFRSAAMLLLKEQAPNPAPVVCLAIVRDGVGEPRFPDFSLVGSVGVAPLVLNLRTADLDRCRPGVARSGLRLLRAATPQYLGTIWETLAHSWIESAQNNASVIELRQMERYVLEVANRRPSRREEELLAAARAEMIKWFPEGIIEEVGMGKYKRMLIEEGRQEGEAFGIRKGEVIGIEVGQRQSIRRLLERRFGPLPEWAVARVDRSTPDERDLWMDRALTVSDLHGVLGEG